VKGEADHKIFSLKVGTTDDGRVHKGREIVDAKQAAGSPFREYRTHEQLQERVLLGTAGATP